MGNRNQMLQLQKEIARIHESLSAVNAEFLDHKRAANSVHSQLQSQIGAVEAARMSPQMQAASYNPDRGSAPQSQTRLSPVQADASPARGAALLPASHNCAAAATQPSAPCAQVTAQPVNGGGLGYYPQ